VTQYCCLEWQGQGYSCSVAREVLNSQRARTSALQSLVVLDKLVVEHTAVAGHIVAVAATGNIVAVAVVAVGLASAAAAE